MAKIVEITDTNFQTEIVDCSIPVLLDFWAEWSGPCRETAPMIDQLAGEYRGRVKVAKVNVDKVLALVGKYAVMGIPTLMLFIDGELVETFVGVVEKPLISSKLNSLV